MKKISIIPLLLCCVLLTGAASPPPVHHAQGYYLNDFAPCMFDAHRDTVLAVSRDLYEKTGVQVVVLTVQSLMDMDIDAYAEAVVRGWEIGGAEGRDGVLILVSTGDRASRVFVGGGLEPLAGYRDARIEVGGNNVSRAIMDVYRPLTAQVYSLNGLAPAEDIQALLDSPDPKNSGPFTPGIIAFLGVVLLAMGRSLRVSRRYRQKYLKGHVRKRKTYTRSRDEEEQYKDQDIYEIKRDGMD